MHKKNSIQTVNSDYVTFSCITSSKLSKSPNNKDYLKKLIRKSMMMMEIQLNQMKVLDIIFYI